jgi:hypothetical protein
MSGQSVSITFPIDAADAEAAARAINQNDLSILDNLAIDRSNCLGTFSRKSWLEYRVNLLILALKVDGLDYFLRRFEGCKQLDEGWSGTALAGETLCDAIDGLTALLARLRRDLPGAMALIDEDYLPEGAESLLDSAPASIAEALERYERWGMADEGEDMACLITFLQGHLAMLEYARRQSKSVLYAANL